MRGLFVTATDTGAGKTVVACGLIRALMSHGLRVAAMKPVASGCDQGLDGLVSDDARRLGEAAGLDVSMDLVNPYRFLPPIAPHVAAAEVGVRIELERIESAFRTLCMSADAVVVEGVGGLRVPLNDREEVADLVALMRLPVVLVVGLRLGCLNHALLTAEALERRGVATAGWVANHIDPAMARQDESVSTLIDRFACPLLGRIPYLLDASADTVARHLDRARILAALGANTKPTVLPADPRLTRESGA